MLPLSIPVMPAVTERVLLSSRRSPRLLVPLSTGDLSKLMLLNYKRGLAIIISRGRNKREVNSDSSPRPAQGRVAG